MCYKCGLFMTKLLILSSDTGEGHNSAATAIAHAARAGGLQATIRRPLEESTSVNRSLANFYNTLLTHRPQWMGWYFRLINTARPNEREFFYSRVRSYIGRFIESESPGILLSVHPMLNHFIQRFIKEEGLGIPCYTYLTDPFPPFWHGWISPHIERLQDGRTRAFGFLEDIHRYVAASDLVVTKPGGLSSYEALACEVPVLLMGMRGLMPQESGLFLASSRYDFGFAARTFEELRAIIQKGPAEWSLKRQALSRFYKSSSGEELIQRIQPEHVRA